jgi:hypothetical protein
MAIAPAALREQMAEGTEDAMTTHEPSYDTEPTYGMRNALRLVLLFHAGGEWDQGRRDEWKRLTGTSEATTKVLCDHIRSALMIGAAGDAGEWFRIYELVPGHVLTERDVEDVKNLLADLRDEETAVEAFHHGRLDGLFEAGGQAAVDRALAADAKMTDDAVRNAVERYKDMAGRR